MLIHAFWVKPCDKNLGKFFSTPQIHYVLMLQVLAKYTPMLLMQRLARVHERQLIIEEPMVSYHAMANRSSTQWQIIPAARRLPPAGDVVISCLLQGGGPQQPAGLAWGFADANAGSFSRFVYDGNTGVWQVAHSHMHKPLTIHNMRGKASLPGAGPVRLAVLYLQEVCYFYLGNLHRPVYQCSAGQMPRPADGIGLCTVGPHDVVITQLRAWSLTTQPQPLLSIESLVDPGFAD
jgi:hypothetical protein